MSLGVLQETLPLVSADAERILMVFINLLTNAINHTPAKGEIVVRLSNDPNSVEFIRASVSDPGPGIRLEEKDWVFERFTHAQADDDSNDAHGIGLGPAIAKSIVEVHRGLIWLESEPGKGSTFYFTLPIVKQQAPAQTEPPIVPPLTMPAKPAPTGWLDNLKKFVSGS